MHSLGSKERSILEDMKTRIYRESFFDVLVDIRNIREILDGLSEGTTLKSLEELGELSLKLSSDLSSLPLPRDLYKRSLKDEEALRNDIILLL